VIASRRRFEHLLAEISVAVDTRISRYALWLRLREEDMDPEALSRTDALAFCNGALPGFLAERRLALSERERRRLVRSVGRFDAELPTPEERFSRWA
jgi:hypothetical protein